MHFGADAIYTGSNYSLRSLTKVDDLEHIRKIISYAHGRSVKVYITVNCFLLENDLQGYRSYIFNIAELQPDALIVSDPGAVYEIKKICPDIPLHLSTQANTLNSSAVKFWAENGIKRINLGRELSLNDIYELKSNSPTVEFEIFAHGALCISLSGKCFLSDFLTKKGANKGKCTHPCRWSYKLIEEKRGREVFYVEEYDKYSCFFSPYDLMALDFLKDILELGLSCIKIEGRMKGPFYTGMAVYVYNKNLNRLLNGKDIDQKDIKRLLYITRRGYGHGFLTQGPAEDLSSPVYERLKNCENPFIGIIDEIKHFPFGEDQYARIKLKNNLNINDNCEILSKYGEIPFRVSEILNEDLDSIYYSKPNSIVYIKIDKTQLSINDMIYRL